MREAGVVGDAGKNWRVVHVESGEGTESAGGARRVVREESDRKSKPQVGISGQYMRKMGGNRNRR